jgi:hypothetical protein
MSSQPRLKETRHSGEYSVSVGFFNRWQFGYGEAPPEFNGRMYDTSVLALAAARRKHRALRKLGHDARLFHRTFAELTEYA